MSEQTFVGSKIRSRKSIGKQKLEESVGTTEKQRGNSKGICLDIIRQKRTEYQRHILVSQHLTHVNYTY